MEEDKKKVSLEELKDVSGGSLRYTERLLRQAGIYMQHEDGTPGSFGILWNSGDYYFQGKKLTEEEIDKLIYYGCVHGCPAASLQDAIEDYDTWPRR